MQVSSPDSRPEVLYGLEGPGFWGDYGSVLVGGEVFEDRDGNPVIRRTGPFVPPIADGGLGYAVTDQFRRELEASGMLGLSFRPITKLKIVKLHWEDWDRTHDLNESWQLPRGEPVDYIKKRKHNPKVAAEMPDLWELVPPRVCAFIVDQPPGKSLLHARFFISWSASAIESYDFVRSRSPRVLVTERAKTWLQSHAAEWVKFEPIPVVD